MLQVLILSKTEVQRTPIVLFQIQENKLPNWFTFIPDSKVWKKGTVLIVGDSVVSSLWKRKMSFRRNIKVHFFPGARIQDIYYYLVPLYVNDQLI